MFLLIPTLRYMRFLPCGRANPSHCTKKHSDSNRCFFLGSNEHQPHINCFLVPLNGNFTQRYTTPSYIEVSPACIPYFIGLLYTSFLLILYQPFVVFRGQCGVMPHLGQQLFPYLLLFGIEAERKGVLAVRTANHATVN